MSTKLLKIILKPHMWLNFKLSLHLDVNECGMCVSRFLEVTSQVFQERRCRKWPLKQQTHVVSFSFLLGKFKCVKRLLKVNKEYVVVSVGCWFA